MFLDRVELCHKIDLLPRLAVPARHYPLADLLLMKLQVVEHDDKDFTTWPRCWSISRSPAMTRDAINVDYLCGLAGARLGAVADDDDGGAAASKTHSASLGDDAIGATVHEKVTVLLERLESTPKSRGWRLRSRVGDRVRWYELPDDDG